MDQRNNNKKQFMSDMREDVCVGHSRNPSFDGNNKLTGTV